MAYTTQAAIEAAIGVTDLAQISDPAGTGTADPSVVALAIVDADSLIDSYAHKRYSVPFATTPPTIATLSMRMTIRNLRRDRRMVLAQDVADDASDRKWLEDLARGMVSVGVQPLPEKSSLEVAKTGERDTTKNVSRSRLKGFW